MGSHGISKLDLCINPKFGSIRTQKLTSNKCLANCVSRCYERSRKPLSCTYCCFTCIRHLKQNVWSLVAGVCSHCRYHIGLRYYNSQWRWPSTSQVLDPTGYDVTFLSSTFNLCATISFSSFTGIKVLDSPCDFGGVVPALCEVPLAAAPA